MGIRISGLASGIDPSLVDKLVEAEGIPLANSKKRKEKIETQKTEFEKLQGFLSELDSAANGLKSKADFYKLKVESSHPDIIDGIVEGPALLGSYEFEVRGLAKSEKELAYGFPDKDQSYVGFGFMAIERENAEDLEVIIEPYSTLQDVAVQINDLDAGVKAIVVNTKYQPDSYRLLVVSEESGKESKITIDEDTTFLEFKEQVTGRNLDVLFEDVPVTDEDNILEELLDDVVFNVKRSEPGTRVQVNIVHDIDKTMEGISAFVEKYNQIADFVHQQVALNPETNQAGILSGDASVKSVIRQLQGSLFKTGGQGYSTLAQIGIKTNPKLGTLEMDEAKVRKALAEDYDSVAQLFIRTRNSVGVAEKVSARLKAFRDPVGGVVRSRIRGLEQIIKNQDDEIARKERQLAQREESIRSQFTALETQMADLKSQGDFLKARFGGGQGGAPQGRGG